MLLILKIFLRVLLVLIGYKGGFGNISPYYKTLVGVLANTAGTFCIKGD